MRNLFILISLIYSSLSWAENVRLISVTGLAEKSFKPDIVRLNIVVWGKGATAKKAQSNNQIHYDLFKKSIETFRVAKEDVSTNSYYLNPDYTYDPRTSVNNITGYTANQGLSIIFRKVDDVGSFIDSLTSSSKDLVGGVSIQNLQFDIDKRSTEERALLGDSVRSAEALAKDLASAAKVKLVGLYRLTPRGIGGPVLSTSYQGDAVSAMSSMRSSKESATQFMNEEIKVRAEVSAEFLIE